MEALESPTFPDLAQRFAAQFDAVRDLVEPRYVRSDWLDRNAELERDLLPVPPADFLRHPAIRYQMFVDEHVVPRELPYVRARLPAPELMAEDAVGCPPLIPISGTPLATSSNTIHQLHHLLRYEDATGRRVADAATVVEWGGGFGSLMRLLVRLHPGAPSCVVLDTPVFSALQWLYLAAVLGEERVVLHSRAPVAPATGRLNVVPIGLAAELEVEADLFVSTWALNESTPAAQRHVIGRAWYGAPSLLLAMDEHDPLAAPALEHGAQPVPLGDFMPAQRYFVR